MSEQGRGNLAEALAKAQAAMAGAKKDSTNPHFKNKYADLASIWEACRKPLTDHGLSVVQYTRAFKMEAAIQMTLVTKLQHISGESVEGEMLLPPGKNMQELGSALTYARRYGLAAMVGVAPEDDDGNAAVAASSGKMTAQDVVSHLQKPAGFDNWRTDFEAAADNGGKALGDAWQASKPEYRVHYNRIVSEDQRTALRARATKADAAVPA